MARRPENNKARYQREKERRKAYARAYYYERGLSPGSCPLRRKYHNHAYCARRRGLEMRLSFEEWIEWWGDDLERRGAGKNDLCMARHGDEGHYELGNIYKTTNYENRALRNKTVAARRRNAES